MIAMIWNNGIWEWGIILVVILIFFGAGKLPSVLGQMGKGVRSFKDGMKDEEDEPRSSNSDDDNISALRNSRSDDMKEKEAPRTSSSDNEIISALSDGSSSYSESDARRDAMKIIYQNLPDHPNYPKD